MYKKVSTEFNFVEHEKKVLEFWKKNKIFEKSMEHREGGPVYTFFDGPPTANGKPHIGHVLTRVIKDLIPRYYTMKGYKVLRKAGWDTHGLPVELEVEKALKIDGKDQIIDYGLEKFVNECRSSVWKYKNMWEDFSDTVGFWADMKNPYITYNNDYIESVWWSLKQIWEKGLLYQGHKIVPYCPRCGTSLSAHEVSQGYKDVKEKSVIVKFKSLDEDNLFFLAWTTTPWTLPSNVALTVNPNEEYIKIKFHDEKYILAAALVDKVFENHNLETEEKEYTILEKYTGKDLEFKSYEPLFNFGITDKKAYFVTCADYVTLTDGTGIVHTAPAFGEDDATVGRKYNLPFIQLVDDKGEFKEEVKPWKGRFVKEADEDIIKHLNEINKLFKAIDYEHSYPHCWRCDTPLLYYAKDTWFIETTKVKDKMIENNNKINWLPESVGKNRFGDWLENMVDWGISRDRFWGTPLNIWECSCGHKHAVGSIEELKSLSNNCPEDIELHRPFIDNVNIKCEKCGEQMTRVKPVIDCWYDSGAMPFAQWHYPFENKEVFEENFPADFISEAVDQTRGWFYSLLAVNTLLFDKPAYKNVIVLGHVQDENGQKMSKSKGNSVDPFEALEKFGADAIRWYFYNNSAPWLPNRFYSSAVVEGQRKFMGTLWNTYAFFVLYANIDNFNPNDFEFDYEKLDFIDKWCLSKLNSLVETVDNNFSNYKITESTRAINNFVDELSNWYVRRSRERFWKKGTPQTKINAYMTLYKVLVTLSKVTAPFVPFISENIYRNLVISCNPNATQSVHLCDFPNVEKSYINKEVEKQMESVLEIVVLGRGARNKANMKNRQPLRKMYVTGEEKLDSEFVNIILEELNIKKLEFIADAGEYIKYKFKPQLKTVGPKYGKLVNKIRIALDEISSDNAMNELKLNESLKFNFDNTEVILSEEDLLISVLDKEGFSSASQNNKSVIIDITLDNELVEEGTVREVISKIQNMRKEADFDIMDKIILGIDGEKDLMEIIMKNSEKIKEETLTKEIKVNLFEGYLKEYNINGKVLKLVIK